MLGVRFHISASAGAAIYNAMYAAKEAGKNCWRFYETTMQEEAFEKMVKPTGKPAKAPKYNFI